MKHTMLTKKDIRQLLKEELSTQKKALLYEVKIMLDRQTKEIHADIGQLLEDSINPLLDHHDKRITRRERNAKLPPMAFPSAS